MSKLLFQNRRLRWGFCLLLFFALLALGAEFIAPVSPTTQNRSSYYFSPGSDRTLPDGLQPRLRFFVPGDAYRWLGFFPGHRHLFGATPPSNFFLLGSDEFGRDIFSRTVYGARVSLLVGLLGVFVSFLVGILLGGFSGLRGGWIDVLIMRGSELFMVLPGLYFLLTLRSVFPQQLSSTVSFFLIVFILSLINWGSIARVIRGMVLSLRERAFVEASRAVGASSTRILWRHLLPNTAPFLIAQALLTIPYYILGEITLSFLGLGIQEPDPSWGNMLASAMNITALTQHPWILSPGVALFLVVLGFNLVGEGLNDALAPRKQPAVGK